jgi:tryptophan 2,3-dioxygenase
MSVQFATARSPRPSSDKRRREHVERIISCCPGTGGSSGVGFLKKALDLTFFPELLEVRTQIRSA